MRGQHATLGNILDYLRGRTDDALETHLPTCSVCSALRDRAERLLAAGQRALSAPRPSRRALRRALRIFREAQAGASPSILALVFDSLLRPAPALRSQATAPTRFLRYEGEATIELQIRGGPRGVELRGQLTPADFASEILLVAGETERTCPVEADGTFLLENVPRRTVELRAGSARIPALEL